MRASRSSGLASTLERFSRGRVIVPLLVATVGVYAYMLLYSIPTVMDYAGGMKLFDMLPQGYSVDYARSLLDRLGEEGRRAYATRQIPVDMVYPALFAVTYSLLLAWSFRKGFRSPGRMLWLSLVPAAAGLFDYLENAGILVMLGSYPDLSPAGVAVCSACSVTKAVLTTVFWLLLLVGFAAMARRRMRRV